MPAGSRAGFWRGAEPQLHWLSFARILARRPSACRCSAGFPAKALVPAASRGGAGRAAGRGCHGSAHAGPQRQARGARGSGRPRRQPQERAHGAARTALHGGARCHGARERAVGGLQVQGAVARPEGPAVPGDDRPGARIWRRDRAPERDRSPDRADREVALRHPSSRPSIGASTTMWRWGCRGGALRIPRSRLLTPAPPRAGPPEAGPASAPAPLLPPRTAPTPTHAPVHAAPVAAESVSLLAPREIPRRRHRTRRWRGPGPAQRPARATTRSMRTKSLPSGGRWAAPRLRAVPSPRPACRAPRCVPGRCCRPRLRPTVSRTPRCPAMTGRLRT